MENGIKSPRADLVSMPGKLLRHPTACAFFGSANWLKNAAAICDRPASCTHAKISLSIMSPYEQQPGAQHFKSYRGKALIETKSHGY
jgi:hypothetical protein